MFLQKVKAILKYFTMNFLYVVIRAAGAFGAG